MAEPSSNPEEPKHFSFTHEEAIDDLELEIFGLRRILESSSDPLVTRISGAIARAVERVRSTASTKAS